MNTYEAKELLANSLRCLAMSMEQIRLREIEKVVGREEPMQDGMYSLPLGYLQSWMEREYWEA